MALQPNNQAVPLALIMIILYTLVSGLIKVTSSIGNPLEFPQQRSLQGKFRQVIG